MTLNVFNSDVSNEYTDLLLKIFKTLPCMNVAHHALTHVGMGEEVLIILYNLIELCKEETYNNTIKHTAFLFPCQANMHDINKYIKTMQNMYSVLSQKENFKDFINNYGLVDGLEGAIVISPAGKMTGIMKYPDSKYYQDVFVPFRYRNIAAASRQSGGLLFLFSENGRINFFNRGFRVMTYRSSKWHIHSMFNTALLETEHGIEKGVIENAVRMAVELIDVKKEVLFTVGDTEGVERYFTIDIKEAEGLKPVKINRRGDDFHSVLCGVQQNGVIVIEIDGTIRHVTTILTSQVNRETNDENDRNVRIADRISEVTGALAITVSHEGIITIYSKGKQAFQIMG